jgi:short-subunit dehydrogenase
MRNAIIVGASSGIGWELAKLLSGYGLTLGIAARRLEKLDELRDSLPTPVLTKHIDVTQPTSAMRALAGLIDEMGEVDLIVIASATGDINEKLDWHLEAACINTNVSGFSAVANVAIKYFINRKAGHLVGISSVAALRGSHLSPAYNASKAFISNYLEGLRKKVTRFGYNITVTEIRPGFVDTPMAKGDGLFWVAPKRKAAEQIIRAIKHKRHCVYITKRWRTIGWLLKVLPDAIYNKL